MQGHLQPLWHSCGGRYNLAPNQLTLIESSVTAECSGTTCGRGSGRNAEERGAGNLHATFCGNRRRATASGDPVARSNPRPYRDHRLKRDQPNLFMNARPRSPLLRYSVR